MAVTPVLACYRTCDAAIGGITAWQVTTGPDGPRTNVVGSCPLGDASWVTPLYHLVVVLCERDGTLVVVHPGREFQVVGTVQLKGAQRWTPGPASSCRRKESGRPWRQSP